MGMGEKPRNTKEKTKNKEKYRLVGLTPTHPVYETEADCFPVSENKPDLP